MLRYNTEIAWFGRLVRHPVRKWSGSILTTTEPAWGLYYQGLSLLIPPTRTLWCLIKAIRLDCTGCLCLYTQSAFGFNITDNKPRMCFSVFGQNIHALMQQTYPRQCPERSGKEEQAGHVNPSPRSPIIILRQIVFLSQNEAAMPQWRPILYSSFNTQQCIINIDSEILASWLVSKFTCHWVGYSATWHVTTHLALVDICLLAIWYISDLYVRELVYLLQVGHLGVGMSASCPGTIETGCQLANVHCCLSRYYLLRHTVDLLRAVTLINSLSFFWTEISTQIYVLFVDYLVLLSYSAARLCNESLLRTTECNSLCSSTQKHPLRSGVMILVAHFLISPIILHRCSNIHYP